MNSKLAAAGATVLWGFTYILSTTLLPHNPLLLGAVRALGGAGILLAMAPQRLPASWWGRMIVLGTLNAGLFFGLLFIAAVRLPGGVAAIFQALGPLIVILLGWAMLGHRPTHWKMAGVLIGAFGVSLVVLKANAALDGIGVLAALGSTVSLGLGGVLINKWQRPKIAMPAFTGWQLLIAGVELGIAALVVRDLPATLTVDNLIGFALLAVFLTAVPFLLWFKAVAHLGAVVVAPFFLLVPITAFTLDAVVKGILPTGMQIVGVATVLLGLFLSQWRPKPARATAATAPANTTANTTAP